MLLTGREFQVLDWFLVFEVEGVFEFVQFGGQLTTKFSLIFDCLKTITDIKILFENLNKFEFLVFAKVKVFKLLYAKLKNSIIHELVGGLRRYNFC